MQVYNKKTINIKRNATEYVYLESYNPNGLRNNIRTGFGRKSIDFSLNSNTRYRKWKTK